MKAAEKSTYVHAALIQALLGYTRTVEHSVFVSRLKTTTKVMAPICFARGDTIYADCWQWCMGVPSRMLRWGVI